MTDEGLRSFESLPQLTAEKVYYYTRLVTDYTYDQYDNLKQHKYESQGNMERMKVFELSPMDNPSKTNLPEELNRFRTILFDWFIAINPTERDKYEAVEMLEPLDKISDTDLYTALIVVEEFLKRNTTEEGKQTMQGLFRRKWIGNIHAERVIRFDLLNNGIASLRDEVEKRIDPTDIARAKAIIK